MRKLLLGLVLSLPISLISPATAMPGATHDPLIRDAVINSDLIEVKGGRGRGGGFGLGRSGGNRAFGWSRGKKVGWRGGGCPPGLARQGRC